MNDVERPLQDTFVYILPDSLQKYNSIILTYYKGRIY